jgi:hypothetical protein
MFRPRPRVRRKQQLADEASALPCGDLNSYRRRGRDKVFQLRINTPFRPLLEGGPIGRSHQERLGQVRHRASVAAGRACFKMRPVRGPGLQGCRTSAGSCRPRALTRRWQAISKHALGRACETNSTSVARPKHQMTFRNIPDKDSVMSGVARTTYRIDGLAAWQSLTSRVGRVNAVQGLRWGAGRRGRG